MAPSPEQRSHSSHSSGSGSKTKSWIPEKVCQVGKNKLVARGAAWIDDTSAISDDLAEKVTAKAFALRMSYSEWDEGDEDESLLAAEAIYHGQVALIEEGKLQDETVTSQTPCRMWTAKHNVTTETTKGIFRKFDKAHILIKGTPYVASFEEVLRDEIPKMKLSGCTSDYGLDLCISSKTYHAKRGKIEKSQMFQVASGVPPAGAKIGIAVFNAEQPVTPPAVGGADEKMFGRKHDTVIHTGEIKEIYAEPPYFLHDINTIESWSGGALFLLDKNQPDSVDPTDYGKIVGIHSSGHPDDGILRNIAFLIGALHPCNQPEPAANKP